MTSQKCKKATLYRTIEPVQRKENHGATSRDHGGHHRNSGCRDVDQHMFIKQQRRRLIADKCQLNCFHGERRKLFGTIRAPIDIGVMCLFSGVFEVQFDVVYELIKARQKSVSAAGG
jgi:hypothetical protein